MPGKWLNLLKKPTSKINKPKSKLTQKLKFMHTVFVLLKVESDNLKVFKGTFSTEQMANHAWEVIRKTPDEKCEIVPSNVDQII